ncbi:hypothetical protein BIY24_15580 [Halobacteriovorax marinus]|uniref:ABC transporter substrate-binding protein n=1 Tax=Halobacteriovorax marinus TaxID=97084 RepID=UPI000BC344A7|nr:ABC transporter substrate-binding protein [Halobacteriovorax marinus]ATH09312.1 hypothetical protein BIY24_15580 [Halobacteriovorax marinus]
MIRLFLLSFLFCSISTWAYEHVRPFPYKIKTLKPHEAYDIVSYSVISLIHKQLFKVTYNNIPEPSVVKSFAVSDDQLTYSFIIKDEMFHDGRKLKIKDVVYTFENALSIKVNGYKKLLNIKGAKEFLDKKADKISGITLNEKERTLKIELLEKAPSFLYFLADPRLSIIYKGAADGVGIGDYKMTSSSPETYSFEYREKKEFKFPSVVTYKYLSPLKAIEYFNKGKVQDLVLYTISKEKMNKLKDANLNLFHYPKLYAFFLNGRRVSDQKRSDFFKHFPKSEFVAKCFGVNKTVNSIIPPGFMGHADLPEEKPLSCKNKKGITILVPEEFGEVSNCISEALSKIRCPLNKVKKVSFSKVLEQWSNNTADAYVGFVEAENAPDFFDHFLPDSPFPLGLNKDARLEKLLSGFYGPSNLGEKASLALEINKHLYENKTIFPLFTEKMSLITSNRYISISIGSRPAATIPMNEYKLR